MGELFWVVVGLASGAFAGYWRGQRIGYGDGSDAGRRAGYDAGFSAGLSLGQQQGIDLANLLQAGKDSARARKAAATRKQRAAIRELGNSEV